MQMQGNLNRLPVGTYSSGGVNTNCKSAKVHRHIGRISVDSTYPCSLPQVGDVRTKLVVTGH